MRTRPPTHTGQVKPKHVDIIKLSAFHFCINSMYCKSVYVIVGVGNEFLTNIT